MKYIRNKELYFKKIKGKWYILEPNKKVMRELNDVAGFIWEVLAKPHNIENLVDLVCEEFTVDKIIAEKDVKKFVLNYKKERYIITC